MSQIIRKNMQRFPKAIAEISHAGLREHKLISASNEVLLEAKIKAQSQKWKNKWEKLQSLKKGVDRAAAQTRDAQSALKEVETILQNCFETDGARFWKIQRENAASAPTDPTTRIDVEISKCSEQKKEPPCKLPKPPTQPSFEPCPSEPDPNSEEFQPRQNILDNLFAGRREKKIMESKNRFSSAHAHWVEQKRAIAESNLLKESEYRHRLLGWEQECERLAEERREAIDENIRRLEQRKAEEIEKWKKAMIEYDQVMAEVNAFKKGYAEKKTAAVVRYCEAILQLSKYPAFFRKKFEVDYNPNNKMLIVEYVLPDADQFPIIREVRYLPAKKEYKKINITQSEAEKIFDGFIYQVVLRTLRELFVADTINAIDVISLNGWVKSIERSTGKSVRSCIVSIQVRKEEFLAVNLKRVEPKACFKQFKGVGSSKLVDIVPVQPILQMDKNDKRFVAGRSVASEVDSSMNLAAMDWEDFEHLVREIFQREFSVNGGEVKVTRASRDGGVDAIAFDPDPIRGGKIVIQAKRYTNTVGVSAVRDLYGTVLNEGATKGILVTTADYGPDAYAFARGKPLTLLNGGHLLHLLRKNGQHARIDLFEAKKIISENEQK